MDNKLILPCEVENVSDGFHTFKELYEHRITLYIKMCKSLVIAGYDKSIWRSMKHSDGSLPFGGGWFVLGIGKKDGEQITYHLPVSEWLNTDFAETLVEAPEYDGHTPEDVLKRIKNL